MAVFDGLDLWFSFDDLIWRVTVQVSNENPGMDHPKMFQNESQTINSNFYLRY